MPHISKKMLPERTRAGLMDDLLEACIALPVRQRTKRLAVVVLLEAGTSWQNIGELLGMSPSTIARIHERTRQGKFKTIASFAKDKRWNKSFWGILERILRAGMPEQGRKRWDWLNKM